MSQEDVESTTTETAMLSPSDSTTSSLSTDSSQPLQNSPAHSQNSEKIQFVSVWEEKSKPKTDVKVRPARSSPASIALLIISSFCCIAFGIVAFYYNKKAFKKYANRENKSGDRYARRARIFAGVAIALGIVIILAIIGAGILLWQLQAEVPLELFHNND